MKLALIAIGLLATTGVVAASIHKGNQKGAAQAALLGSHPEREDGKPASE